MFGLPFLFAFRLLNGVGVSLKDGVWCRAEQSVVRQHAIFLLLSLSESLYRLPTHIKAAFKGK
jgi:hypothetical protein